MPTPRPIEGYWIQNTTREGLCSDHPRFIGYDYPLNRIYVGDGGTTICYFDYFDLERWPREYPSPMFSLPHWVSESIPVLRRVTGVAGLPPPIPAAYDMPSFVGDGGQCVPWMEDYEDEIEWRCFTSADGLPFDDVRGYGVVQESNVEWFMSDDSVASRGLSPEELFYAIPELVGAADARPTWLYTPYFEDQDVWVGTNGYGVLRIEPDERQVTRYTTADGLPDDVIRDVQAYDDTCWVATAGGVGYWDGASWTAYTTADGLPGDDVRGVDHYRDTTWVATAAGPALLLRETNRWQTPPNFPTGVEVNGVLKGVFSTRGQGLVTFFHGPVALGQTTWFTAAHGLLDDHITALAATESGILVGTPRGAVEGNGEVWTPITAAAVNDAGRTALATDAGLWLRNGGEWTQVTSERVIHVAEDGWYATPDRVCRWKEDRPVCPATTAGGNVAGTQVLTFLPQTNELLAIDENARHWLYDARACPSGCFVESTPLNNLAEFIPPHHINDLAVQDDLWRYATERGIYAAPLEGGDYPFIGWGDHVLSNEWPIAVRDTSRNPDTDTVWIATNQGAFYSNQAERWTYVGGIPVRDLTAVLAMPDGSAWIGTADVGLIYFEPNRP
jgi:hypothetical protein